jgi:hypothetical protein
MKNSMLILLSLVIATFVHAEDKILPNHEYEINGVSIRTINCDHGNHYVGVDRAGLPICTLTSVHPPGSTETFEVVESTTQPETPNMGPNLVRGFKGLSKSNRLPPIGVGEIRMARILSPVAFAFDKSNPYVFELMQRPASMFNTAVRCYRGLCYSLPDQPVPGEVERVMISGSDRIWDLGPIFSDGTIEVTPVREGDQDRIQEEAVIPSMWFNVREVTATVEKRTGKAVPFKIH